MKEIEYKHLKKGGCYKNVKILNCEGDFDNVDFDNVDLELNSLYCYSFKNSELKNINFEKMCVEQEVLNRADFTDANLTNINFNSLKINWPIFRGTTLENVTFDNTKINWGEFQNTTLKKVSFRSSTLKWCNFHAGKGDEVIMKPKERFCLELDSLKTEDAYSKSKRSFKEKLAKTKNKLIKVKRNDKFKILDYCIIIFLLYIVHIIALSVFK